MVHKNKGSQMEINVWEDKFDLLALSLRILTVSEDKHYTSHDHNAYGPLSSSVLNI